MNISTFSVSSILLSFLFLASCGGRDDLNDDIYRVNGEGDTPAESLKLADFRCDTSNCPKNIGLLATNDYGNGPARGQCTAFLVADDIVATNSHCIPDQIKSTFYKRDCSKYMAIKFQAEGNKKKIFKCKNMLNFSNYKYDSGGQDFAFFKIDSTGRKPFKINKTGIKDNESLTIQKITPLKYTFGGRLAVQRCRNVQNSLVNMDATNPWSTSGAVIDCDVTQGNSGSPIVNTSGHVVGIAQAFWKDAYVDSVREAMKDLDIVFKDFPTHSLFTNLSCVKDPVTNRINENLCAKGKEISMAQCILPTSDRVLKSMKDNVETWSQELNPSFVYEINSVGENSQEALGSSEKEEMGHEKKFIAKPICAKRSSAKSDTSGLFKSRLGITEVYKGSMVLEAKMSLDDDLRFDMNASTFKKVVGLGKVINLTLDPETRIWSGFHVSLGLSQLPNRDEASIQIPECSTQMISEGNLIFYTMDDGSVVKLEDYRFEDEFDEEDLAVQKTCKELGAM